MAMQDTVRRISPAGFVAWWVDELAALVPDALKGGRRRRGQVLVVERRDGFLIARKRAGGHERELGRIDLRRASGSDREQFGRLVSRADRRSAQVVLRLPSADVLERRLELPAVSDADLRNALYFEIDRQTPFRADETYFDYVVSGRHADGKRLAVDLTVIPRRVVEDAAASLAEWGIVPDAAEIASGPERPATRVRLRREAAAATGLSFGKLINWLLLASIVGALAAAAEIPVDGRRQVAEALAAEAQRARLRADNAVAMRKELDDLLQSRRSLRERKLNARSTVAILEELTRLLPDDAWIADLQIDGDEVRLTGYATAAASLIGLIDASPRFQTPRFLSPVTHDGRLAKERFSLAFELERGGAT